MRFSFRIFLAFVIILGLGALVIQQVLVGFKNNSQTTFSQEFFNTINPFWKAQNPDVFNNFPVNIPLPVVNPTDGELLVSGKIFLFDSNNNSLTGIGVINTTTTSSGTLVDYLPVNTERITIAPQTEYIFNNYWQGFGDQYIPYNHNQTITDSGSISSDSAEIITQPIITFQTLADIFQISDNYDLKFYEKTVIKHHHYDITAKVELTTQNTTTNIETIQPLQEIPLSIPYVTIEKTINTGLFVNFGILMALILTLWAISSPREPVTKTPRISKEELEKIEAELERIKEKRKVNKKKHFKKKKS